VRALVSLVGAGPGGDPDLWTLRAIHRLEAADLVICDKAVDLSDVRRYTRAPIVSAAASVQSGSDRNVVHHQMICTARAGKRVVRLFSSETFAVGCSEDALTLREAGIVFEIVPGISSAIALPELERIPVTHRGVASGFVVLSDPSPKSLPLILQRLQPRGVSLVILSEVSAGSAIAQALIELGWGNTTPAAVVCHAAEEHQRVWSGSLARLQVGEAAAVYGRGVIIVGEVVHVRDALVASAAGVPDIEVQYGRH